MTATLSTDFANHLKDRSQNRCWLLRLLLADGAEMGFTDHNRVIPFDLGAGEIDYRPDLGMVLSNVQTGIGLDAGNFEVTFPITDEGPFTVSAVTGGRFNRAEARLAQVIWSNLGAGTRKFMLGNAGEWRVEGGKAISEVRDGRDRLNQTVGRILQNQCDADYADQVRCFATPTEIDAVVTAVIDAMRFSVSFTGSYADAFFNRGKAAFTSGGNAGTRPITVESWTSAGAITLFMPLVEAPEVGDELTVTDGCARTADACMAHGQILNFRGFREVPGTKALVPAIPSQSAGGGGGKGGK